MYFIYVYASNVFRGTGSIYIGSFESKLLQFAESLQ